MKHCISCNRIIKGTKDRHKKCSQCRDTKKERICKLCSKTFIGTRNKCKTCKSRIDQQRLLKTHKGRKLLASIESKKRAKIKNAIPKWANLKEIKEFYINCPEGFQVDHIIPINNSNVCGLHTLENLQYLKSEENLFKSNKFDGTYNNQSWKEEYLNEQQYIHGTDRQLLCG